MRDIPPKLLEKAVEEMRNQRGSVALNLVREYDIRTFTQLERACREAGVRTWKEPLTPEEIAERERKESPYPFGEASDGGTVELG